MMYVEKSKIFFLFERILMFLILPLIGIFIPFSFGLFSALDMSKTLASYGFSIGLTFLIWWGCRTVFLKLRFSYRFHFEYNQFILVYYSIAAAYSFSIAYFCFSVWFKNYLHFEWNILFLSVVAVFLAAFISTIYEVVFLYAQANTERSKNRQLKKAKLATEMNLLKARIEPHFLFNSLSTLQNLIIENKEAANEFNKTLGTFYHQVLVINKEDCVSISKEVEILYRYYYLISIRFPDAIILSVHIDEFDLDHILIPPLSLQMLLENAIKHNSFSADNPMNIHIMLTKEHIVFSNVKTKEIMPQVPSANGLRILNDRFRYLFNASIEVQNDENLFTVQLPVKLQAYESTYSRR